MIYHVIMKKNDDFCGGDNNGELQTWTIWVEGETMGASPLEMLVQGVLKIQKYQQNLRQKYQQNLRQKYQKN